MKTVRMSSGFSATIDEACFDDMELLELIADTEKGKPTALPGLAEKILGKEQKNKLYDYHRTTSGRVPIQEVTADITELIQAAGGKNS